MNVSVNLTPTGTPRYSTYQILNGHPVVDNKPGIYRSDGGFLILVEEVPPNLHQEYEEGWDYTVYYLGGDVADYLSSPRFANQMWTRINGTMTFESKAVG